jgi:cysteinyl-tRNA synthetase
VNLGAKKMSKSLGNTLTIKDLVRRHDPEALRLYLLGTHYRHPLDFAEARIDAARRALERFRALLEAADRLASEGTPAPGSDDGLLESVATPRGRFEAAMDDDFNTPQAIAALFEMASVLHTYRDGVERAERPVGPFLLGVSELLALGHALGLFQKPVETGGPPREVAERIGELVRARDDARARRDWRTADALRAELTALGATIEDTPHGTRWKWTPR